MRRNCAERRFPLKVDLEGQELNATHTGNDGNWWIFYLFETARTVRFTRGLLWLLGLLRITARVENKNKSETTSVCNSLNTVTLE